MRAESGAIITQNNVQAGGGNSRAGNSGAVIFTKDGSDPSTETNATNIATNTTNIATNTSNIASNLTKINADIMQANIYSVTITQSGNGSTTQCVVSGHTSLHLMLVITTILLQKQYCLAINSIPKNLSGHTLHFVFGNNKRSNNRIISSNIFLRLFLVGIFN